MEALLFISLMLLVVFVPPLVYLVSVRRAERYMREPWGPLLGTFSSGAVVAIIISLILSFILWGLYSEVVRVYEVFEYTDIMEALILACVIAPIVEEAAKGWVVWRRRKRFFEEEDGLVYGSAAGLGFSATENLFYGIAAYLIVGIEGFFILVLVRSISAVFLHASASAIMGYGFSRSKLHATSAVPYYLAAVALHSFYNLLASLTIIMGEKYSLLSLFMAIFVGWASFKYIKKKIRYLDSGGKRRS